MTYIILNESEIAALKTLGTEIGVTDLASIFQKQACIFDFNKLELAEKNAPPTVLAQTTFPGTMDICEKVTLQGPLLQEVDDSKERTLSFRLHVERACEKDGKPSTMNLLVLSFKKASFETALKNTHIRNTYTPDDLAIIPKSESPLIQKLVEIAFREKGSFPHVLLDANTALDMKYI